MAAISQHSLLSLDVNVGLLLAGEVYTGPDPTQIRHEREVIRPTTAAVVVADDASGSTLRDSASSKQVSFLRCESLVKPQTEPEEGGTKSNKSDRLVCLQYGAIDICS